MSVVKSLFFLSRNSFLGAGLSYIATILLARHMGPNEFGLYSYVLVLGALASIFINFSTDTTAAASYARSKNLVETISSIYSFRLFAFSLLLIVSLIALFEDRSIAFGIVAVNVATLNLSFIFELNSKNVEYSTLYMFERFLFSAFVVLLILYDFIDVSITAVFMIIFLISLGSLVLQLYINSGHLRKFRFNITGVYTIARENVFLVLVALSTFAYGGISRILLETKLGQSQLGVYSAGWQFILAITIFSAQVNRIFRIRFSSALVQSDLRLLQKHLREFFLLSTIPVIVISASFFLFGKGFIGVLFGEEYAEINLMVPWLCVYFIVINLDSLNIILWTAKGKRSEYFLISSLWSAVLIGLLLLLPQTVTLDKFLIVVVICHGCSVISLLARFSFLLFQENKNLDTN